MSSNDNLLDGYTRHQIFVLRYSKGREAEAAAHIERLVGEVIGRLQAGGTDFSIARQQQLLAELIELMAEINGDFSTELVEQLLEFANYEADFNFRLLGQNVSVSTVMPAPQQIASAVYTNVMQLEPTKGYTIAQMLAEFGTKKSSQIISFIRDGFTLGDTTQQIVSRIRDNTEMQKRQAEALTRTALNHVAIQARQVTMRENSDVIEGYEWLSTLDSRTSLICASRDGIIYEDVDANPKPPAHFNCRSTITYVVKPEFSLGRDIKVERPAKGAQGTTQVSEDTNYERWLRRQPAAFQDEVLGRSRGKLFREGNLSIGSFVDNTGKVLSLKDLRGLEPLVFDNLGI